MSIKKKLIMAFLIIMMIEIFIVAINLSLAENMYQNFEQITDQGAPAIIALGQIKTIAQRVQIEAVGFGLIISEKELLPAGMEIETEKAEEEEAEELEEAQAELESWLTQYETLTINAEKQTAVQEIHQLAETNYQLSQQIVRLKEEGTHGETIIDLKEELEDVEAELLSIIDQAIETELIQFEQDKMIATNSWTFMLYANIGLVVVAIILVVIFGWGVVTFIATPIVELKEAALKVGQGEFDTQVVIQSQDELGILGTTFNQMAGQLKQMTDSLELRSQELLHTNEQLEQEIADRERVEAERERLQQEIIEAQQQTIQELSTPIIPVMDQIIVMPVVGNIDTLRARDLMRTLLEGISKYRAKVVILDITGVSFVDTGIAAHLDKTVQAARLKGSQTIVTGMSDSVAETIVDLGIDWSQIETVRDLQTGLLVALQNLGVKLR